MRIEDHLTQHPDELQAYFPSDKREEWLGIYRKKIEHIAHDEPWVTLVAMFSLFGDQKDITQVQLAAFNDLVRNSGISDFEDLNSIERVVVEQKLPEILTYRKHLSDQRIHFYPDRITKMDKKKESSSFEGSTNLDLFIEGTRNGEKAVFFIEAKFLSDISYQIFYNPFRDQIARNIDCGIDYYNNDENQVKPENFHFLLLTPQCFRTDLYGGTKRAIDASYQTQKSRLYCYKMDEYKDPKKLAAVLPHRADQDFSILSKNMGWITFEDIFQVAKDNQTIVEKIPLVEEFMRARNLVLT